MNVATIISDAPSDKLSQVDVVRAKSILGAMRDRHANDYSKSAAQTQTITDAIAEISLDMVMHCPIRQGWRPPPPNQSRI